MSSFIFEAIGTRWQIDTAIPLRKALQEELLSEVCQFDHVFSRLWPDSLVADMVRSATGGRFRFADVAAPLFDLYDRLRAPTSKIATEDMAAALSFRVRSADRLDVSNRAVLALGRFGRREDGGGDRLARAAAFGMDDTAGPVAIVTAYMAHAGHATKEPSTYAIAGECVGISPPSAMQRRVDARRRQGTNVEFRESSASVTGSERQAHWRRAGSRRHAGFGRKLPGAAKVRRMKSDGRKTDTDNRGNWKHRLAGCRGGAP